MTFNESLGVAIRQYLCASIAAGNNFYDTFRNTLFNPTGVPTPLLNGINDWYRAANLNICNRDRVDDVANLPFAGGQCPVQYYVTTRKSWGAFPNPVYTDQLHTDPVFGKIKRIEQRTINNGLNSCFGVVGGSNTDPDAEVFYPQVCNPPGTEYYNYELVQIVRVDQLPDTCGDPDVEIPPPTNNYNIHNVDIDYVNNEGNSVTIPVVLVYGQAFVDANLNLQIPVQVQLSPEFSFKANFDVGTGDIKFDFAPRVNINSGNTSISSGNDNRGYTNINNYNAPTPPPAPPPGSESDDVPPPPTPETEKIIRAVIVTVTQVNESKVSTLFQTGANPDILIPNVGYVQFAIRVGASVSWTKDIPVKSTRAFIPCEWEGGAIDVAGTPAPGCLFTLTPVYGATG